jgi:Transposase, Mutator family
LERRRRSEQALVQVIAECYVRGISTRRVDGVVNTLGIDGISKSQVSAMARSLDPIVEAFRNRLLDAGPYRYVWIDALVLKCREGEPCEPSSVRVSCDLVDIGYPSVAPARAMNTASISPKIADPMASTTTYMANAHQVVMRDGALRRTFLR